MEWHLVIFSHTIKDFNFSSSDTITPLDQAQTVHLLHLTPRLSIPHVTHWQL